MGNLILKTTYLNLFDSHKCTTFQGDNQMVSDYKSILGLPSKFKNGQLNYKTLLMIKFLLPAHLYQVEVMIKFIEVDVHYIDTFFEI